MPRCILKEENNEKSFGRLDGCERFGRLFVQTQSKKTSPFYSFRKMAAEDGRESYLPHLIVHRPALTIEKRHQHCSYKAFQPEGKIRLSIR